MRRIPDETMKLFAKTRADLASVREEIDAYLDDVRLRLSEFVFRAHDIAGVAVDELAGIIADAEAYRDDRSEMWKDSAAGNEYDEWIIELEIARDTLNETIVLDIDAGVNLDLFDTMADALDGEGFRQSPND